LDGEAFLAEAIESVIAQTFDSWELFLVDDGSGPIATGIAQDYAAKYSARIHYLEHSDHANLGSSAARNLGIRHARGELIAVLDADDVWLPDKVTQQVALLDAHPEAGMVCGTTIYWHSWAGGEDQVVPTGHRQDVIIYPPDAVPAVFPFGSAPGPSMSDIVLRTALVKQLGGFEDQFPGHYESRVFLSKVFLHASVYFSSATTNKVRIHQASCVATAFREGRHLENRLKFLEWFEQYLKMADTVDARVMSALRRELRPYRSPRIHYFISAVSKGCVTIRSRLRIRTKLRSIVHGIRLHLG
jgi:glycosyltransferase involved in cell wall biosynthesis